MEIQIASQDVEIDDSELWDAVSSRVEDYVSEYVAEQSRPDFSEADSEFDRRVQRGIDNGEISPNHMDWCEQQLDDFTGRAQRINRSEPDDQLCSFGMKVFNAVNAVIDYRFRQMQRGVEDLPWIPTAESIEGDTAEGDRPVTGGIGGVAEPELLNPQDRFVDGGWYASGTLPLRLGRYNQDNDAMYVMATNASITDSNPGERIDNPLRSAWLYSGDHTGETPRHT